MYPAKQHLFASSLNCFPGAAQQVEVTSLKAVSYDETRFFLVESAGIFGRQTLAVYKR